MTKKDPIVSVKHLKQYFNVGKPDEVKAVDDISFDIYPGETLGLVGESGSGKSTTGRDIIRLYDPTDGEIDFEGKNISKLKRKQMKDFRSQMQMIFQDPYASLNPRMKVEDIIAEGLDINHLVKNADERDKRVHELLHLVNLNE
ncbi:oligopeptide ABC transporter, ATP-binding subunit [Fructilactobacillus fructivorans]|nr:oligopeptide ABC transporter, ATP-binding subunit [Fructilactobacillus fructivorans]